MTAVLAAVAFSLLVLGSAIAEGHLMRPGPLFGAFWGFLIVSPLVLLPAFASAYTYEGVLLIWMSCAAFCVGSLVGGRTRVGIRRHDVLSLDRSRLILVAGSVCGLAAAVIAIRRGGFYPSQMLSLDVWLDLGHNSAVARYQGGVSKGPLVAGLNGLALASTIFAPFAPTPGVPRLLRWAPLLTCILYSAATTERLGMLFAIAVSVAGVTINRLGQERHEFRFGVGSLLKGFLAAFSAAVIFILVALLRVGSANESAIGAVFNKLGVYALGAVPAFSQWAVASNAVGGERLGWGSASFPFVYWFVGQDRASTRAYNEFVVIGIDGSRTNVYTGFRSLILDFGAAGALLFLFSWGILTSVLLRRVVATGSVVSGVALCGNVGVLMLMHSMMVTTFTNVTLAVVVAVLGTIWASRTKVPRVRDGRRPRTAEYSRVSRRPG